MKRTIAFNFIIAFNEPRLFLTLVSTDKNGHTNRQPYVLCNIQPGSTDYWFFLDTSSGVAFSMNTPLNILNKINAMPMTNAKLVM